MHEDHPAALRLHRSAGSSTACAAVRAGGSAAANAGANPQPQPAGSQDNGNGNLVLPQLNRLQPYSVSTPSHAAIEQALAPIQGLASALRWHAF
jgi:hypothetical protein